MSYFGIYRGACTNNADPHKRRRIKATVPEILGARQESGWMEPSQPVGVASVPTVGQPVWVAFEGGDPSRPVWLGTWPSYKHPNENDFGTGGEDGNIDGGRADENYTSLPTIDGGYA